MQNSISELNNVRDTNMQITYDGNEMLLVLQEIEFILLSLHNIGSFYSDKDRREYEKETTEFIDNSLICERLAKMRTFLVSKFDLSEGVDEMDDVERACENIQYWTKPGESSQEKWMK